MTPTKIVGAFLLFAVAFGFYVRNAAPSVTTGDSGEFITAAATLALPHSPSFPLYVVAARTFVSVVPFGTIAYRCNVFSAFTSALTLVLLLVIAWSFGASTVSGFVVALVFAFSGSFWENSLVTEVFSLNTLLAAAVTGALLKTDENHAAYWLLALFIMGVGAGNHQVLMLLGPMFVVVGWLERRWIWRREIVIVGSALFLIGFSIYLVLPIRARAEPPLNWGRPTTAAKLKRTILREDYGTLTLALGEKPDRSLGNGVRHVVFFVRQTAREVSWPIWILGAAALLWGAWRRDRFAWLMLVGFVFSGPFFIWLGNLPLTPQSEGIIGRFLILPVFFLAAGIVLVLRDHRKIGSAIVAILIVGEFGSGWSLAADHRTSFLVLDYGRSMLRSLPANASLFMDGGDDAFYSLAMLQNVMNKRSDVELHDRGGLVYPNPYGSDFRSLPKENKAERRWSVEKEHLQRKPLYYVTMDPNVLPGVSTFVNGIVVQAKDATPPMWPFYAVRSLYPPYPDTFRTRALAAFFPYAYARTLQNAGLWRAALRAYARSWQIGSVTDWLKTNMSYEFAVWGYRELIADHLDVADAVYRQWISFEPDNFQAQSNFGVVLEKMGRVADARAQYEKTARLFPGVADPVFNLSVLAWKRGDWPEVIKDLEEVLRRNPNHPQAPNYLIQARQRMAAEGKK